MIKKRTQNMTSAVYLTMLLALSIIILTGCGDSQGQDPAQFSNNKTVTANTNTGGLSDFETKNGIGPVKQIIELSALDLKLAKQGEDIFLSKCASCHKLDERYVGPAQRNILERRSPEYIMNMMLNPEEMYKKHPEAKKLLAEFMTPMPNQNLSFDEARSILEYFRKAGTEK